MIKEKALRSALRRLLWVAVADNSDCTCDEQDDTCALCEAWRALEMGDQWPGAWAAGQALGVV